MINPTAAQRMREGKSDRSVTFRLIRLDVKAANPEGFKANRFTLSVRWATIVVKRKIFVIII